MQTYFTDLNVVDSFKNLDNKRLAGQRRELCQLVNYLLLHPDRTGSYANHTVVRMWRGYESYLVKVYMKQIITEWENRGYNNIKILEYYKNCIKLVKNKPVIRPEWLDEEMITMFKSKLISKNPECYQKLWPDVSSDIEFIWPVAELSKKN